MKASHSWVKSSYNWAKPVGLEGKCWGKKGEASHNWAKPVELKGGGGVLGKKGEASESKSHIVKKKEKRRIYKLGGGQFKNV